MIGRAQHLDGSGDPFRIGPGDPVVRAPGPDIGKLGLAFQNVRRKRQHDRSPGRVLGHLECPGQDDRNLFRGSDFDRPFDDRPGHAHHIVGQHGLPNGHPAVLLPHRHHDRRLCHGAVVKRADGVSQTGGHMKIGNPGFSRCQSVQLGDAKSDGLLKRQNICNIRVVLQDVDKRQLGRAGVSEYILDPLCLKNIHDRFSSGHDAHKRFPPSK